MSEEAGYTLGAGDVAPPPRQVVLRSRAGAKLDQVLAFGGAILLGTVVMWLPLAVELHALTALGLTAIYCITGTILQWHRRVGSGEHFIDSCYYLGFIFTQIALGLSFWKAFQNKAEFTADQLVPLVATALGASVIGLIAKVLLDQVVDDASQLPEEIERNMREMAKKIAADTKTVADTFEALAAQIRDAVRSAGAVVGGASQIEQQAHSQQQALHATLGDLSASVDALKSQMSEAGRSANAGVVALSDDLRTAISLMGQMREIAARINDLGGVAQTVLQESTAAFSVGKQAVQTVDRRLEEDLRRLSDQLSGVAERIVHNADGAVRQNIDDLRRQLTDSVSSITGELETAKVAIANEVDRFGDGLKALGFDAERERGEREREGRQGRQDGEGREPDRGAP